MIHGKNQIASINHPALLRPTVRLQKGMIVRLSNRHHSSP